MIADVKIKKSERHPAPKNWDDALKLARAGHVLVMVDPDGHEFVLAARHSDLRPVTPSPLAPSKPEGPQPAPKRGNA